jgi:hypothetical protein
VLIERFTGLATLVMLTIATAATSARSSHQPLIATTILCASLGCGLAFLLAMSASARIWCLAVARKLPWLRGAATWLASLHAELTLFARPGRMLAGAFLYSLVFYVLCSVSVYVAARAVDFDASYAATCAGYARAVSRSRDPGFHQQLRLVGVVLQRPAPGHRSQPGARPGRRIDAARRHDGRLSDRRRMAAQAARPWNPRFVEH